MISVLIPVYNYNIKNLIKKLRDQLIKANIIFEIVCIDDASSMFVLENEHIKSISNVQFIKLKNNIGRSRIRNLLAEKAKFNWLLFLDADVLPKSDNFIIQYLNYIQSNKASVYCGGIVYEKLKPVSEKLLRWSYGEKREGLIVSERDIYPYKYFFGANFLINKKVFESCRFNNDLIKYGYEDVLFAKDLKNNNISISHVENVVFHFGLDSNLVFLEKTKQALENLHELNKQQLLTGDSIKILKIFQKVKAFRLIKFFSKLYVKYNKLFENNLKSKKPNLFIFDFYKLSYFCYLNVKLK